MARRRRDRAHAAAESRARHDKRRSRRFLASDGQMLLHPQQRSGLHWPARLDRRRCSHLVRSLRRPAAGCGSSARQMLAAASGPNGRPDRRPAQLQSQPAAARQAEHLPHARAHPGSRRRARCRPGHGPRHRQRAGPPCWPRFARTAKLGRQRTRFQHRSSNCATRGSTPGLDGSMTVYARRLVGLGP